MKRYIDVYSKSSPIGFSGKDLSHISNLYADAQDIWSRNIKPSLLFDEQSSFPLTSAIKIQIDAYSNFLMTVAGLARSKWTEFNLRLMSIGLCLMAVSIFIHVLIIKSLDTQFRLYFHLSGNSGISLAALLSYIIVLIRACSFLSNSFICKSCSCIISQTEIIIFLRYILLYVILISNFPVTQWKKAELLVFFWLLLEYFNYALQ